MSPGLYRVIGTLEVAGASGLLLGPASAPLGLAVLMVAAAVVHLCLGDPPVQALPAAVLALTAVASPARRSQPADGPGVHRIEQETVSIARQRTGLLYGVPSAVWNTRPPALCPVSPATSGRWRTR
ncbi:DoxX family protein [Streptomyces scabiei]|uniref:DoxX family protein n=1 Tax=Streptomyces scabiei TaxID=1930 RepID=UPI001F194BF2|nr:DoxX family protein [Streptomyces scabiei]